MERVLGLNQSLVDSFAKQQPTPEPSSESLQAPPARTPPSKLSAGANLVLFLPMLVAVTMFLSHGCGNASLGR